ncbi:MAG: hypothetical protein SFY80_01260 [Verrucomicrobiota bacterium]|nr:hypothetical protein [Verrucomicrobiota bacterium]
MSAHLYRTLHTLALVLATFSPAILAGQSTTLKSTDTSESPAAAIQDANPATTPELESPTIFVADTYTRISLAKVYLDIGQLKLEADGCFTGTYNLTVPLRHSKDESGALRLSLPKDCPFETFLVTGGTMHGIGKSPKAELPPRGIEATVVPDAAHPGCGKLLLTINTGARVLHFESVYSVTPPQNTALDAAVSPSGKATVALPGKKG